MRERHAFTLAAASAITDEPGHALLLRSAGGRKKARGWSSLQGLNAVAVKDPARFDRVSFAVTAAVDILALDADTPEAAQTAVRVAELADSAGCPPVVVTSGRPGNVHVFARVQDPRLLEVLTAAAREGGVDVRTGSRIRPPLSAHPDGGHGELLEPTDPTEALLRLVGDGSDHPPRPVKEGKLLRAPSRPERRLAGPPLSAAMDQVLRHGDGNPDRSATLQRVVTALVNRGWTLEAAWELLRSRHAKCASKLHERKAQAGEDAAYRYLAVCWASAEAFVAENPAIGVDPATAAELDRIQTLADSVPWPGESGSSSWMVLHQLIEIGRRGGGLSPTASERQLAENASMCREAVHAALGRLMDSGWLDRVRIGSGQKATLWSFGPLTRRTEPLPHPPLTQVGGCEVSGQYWRGSADAFRRGAIGTSGYRILRHLARVGEATTAELAEVLGLHQGTVAKILKTRLGAVGIVQRHGRSWSLCDVDIDEALDWAATKFGTAGAGERQRRFHKVERALYRFSGSWGADLAWWDNWESGSRTPPDISLAAA